MNGQSDEAGSQERLPTTLGYGSTGGPVARPRFYWIVLNRLAGLALDALLIRFFLLPYMGVLGRARMTVAPIGFFLSTRTCTY